MYSGELPSVTNNLNFQSIALHTNDNEFHGRCCKHALTKIAYCVLVMKKQFDMRVKRSDSRKLNGLVRMYFVIVRFVFDRKKF